MVARKTIVVDFNTKFIASDIAIWVIFPGEGYKFFEYFTSRDSIFGDFPGLLLKEFSIDNDEELKRRIVVSEKVRVFHQEKKQDRPSRAPAAYAGYSWTGKRMNTKGVVNGLYSRAKKGDLVLVTSRGGAWGTTHIGEIQDDPGKPFYVEHPRYPDEDIPARAVRWLSKIENRLLPQELVHQLASQNAFTRVGRQYWDQILAAAYDNFFRADTSTSLFNIRSEEFSTVPDMYLKIIANFAAEICRGVENDDLDKFLNTSIVDWILNLRQDEFSALQRININSPGSNLLQSIKNTAILAAALFALGQYSAAELRAAEIVFVNSAAGGQLDDCDIPVAENAKLAASKMSLEKLEILCRASQQAKQLARIETPITTKVVEGDEQN